MNQHLPIELAAWAIGGAALGSVYLNLIARSVAAMTPAVAIGPALGWLLLRIALAGLVMGIAAAHGAATLIATLAGFLVVRTYVLARTGWR